MNKLSTEPYTSWLESKWSNIMLIIFVVIFLMWLFWDFSRSMFPQKIANKNEISNLFDNQSK